MPEASIKTKISLRKRQKELLDRRYNRKKEKQKAEALASAFCLQNTQYQRIITPIGLRLRGSLAAVSPEAERRHIWIDSFLSLRPIGLTLLGLFRFL